MKEVVERRGQEYFAVTHYDNGLRPNRRRLESEVGQNYERVAREDYGRRFWSTILAQEIATLESGKSWRKSSTVMERQILVELWKELSQEEKLAYAGHSYGNWGDTARALGLTDTEVHLIGLCGSPEPVLVEESADLNRLKDEVEQKLIQGLVARGVDSPNRRFHSILWGIKEIVTEDLGNPNVDSDEWKTVYKQRKENFYNWLLTV